MKPAVFHIGTVNIHLPAPRKNVLEALLEKSDGIHVSSVQAAEVAAPARRFQLAYDGTIVIDHRLQLMWPVDESEKEMNHDDREKYAADFRLGGFSDWRQADRWELLSLCASGKYKPAIDTDLFRSHGSWVGTREVCPWSSGSVFLVYFSLGDTGSYDRFYRAFCRPVRSLVAGQ